MAARALEKVRPLRRRKLWKAFWFGVAMGLLLAVIHHATEEFRYIRALLFE